MANAFDDLPPENSTPVSAAPPTAANVARANAFDDLTPPPKLRPKDLPPATAADRAQALESGVWRGGSYLAAMLPDAAANTFNLGKAAIGTGYGELTAQPGLVAPTRTSGANGIPLYHYVDKSGQEIYSKDAPPAGAKPYVGQPTTNIPAGLQMSSGASPVGARLAEALDRFHDYTPTTVDRPDDAASRYLSAAGSVIPGAAVGGGGSIGGTFTAALAGTPSALAGQAVTDAHPFKSDWANTLASAGAQLGTSVGVPAVTKAVLRGPSGETMQANADAFREAGAEPSVGQASGVRRTQFLESMLAKVPGGAGVFHKFAGQQAADLGEGAQNTVSGLSQNVRDRKSTRLNSSHVD